jgi:hypothetical protein
MYFETTMHASREVSGAAEAATLIKTGEVHDYDALIWSKGERRLCVVADNHCNNPWGEVAVVELTKGYQIESITAGWCKGNQLREYLEECETTDFRMSNDGSVTVPLDGQGDDTPADFECGCCGASFESTLSVQRKYDQDNGYGFCRKCAR